MTKHAENTERVAPHTQDISRTLYVSASRRAETNESIVTRAQSFEDTPRASVMTRRRQPDGRHFCSEFRGRSTHQRHHTPRTPRGSSLTLRVSRTPHAPASRRAGPRLTRASKPSHAQEKNKGPLCRGPEACKKSFQPKPQT